MTAVHVDRIILGRYERGVDHESRRAVLARDAQGHELLWQFAGKGWVNLLHGYQPFPARLVLRDTTNQPLGWAAERALHEGGRLSRRLLATHEKAIDEFFGIAVVARLLPGKTLLLGGAT